MVSATIGKVTGRVRQVVRAKFVPGMLPEQRAMLDETAERERTSMRELFALMEESLTGWASGSKDQMVQIRKGSVAGQIEMIKQWGERWLRVFRRKSAVEEAWFVEAGKEKIVELPAVVAEDGIENGDVKIDEDLP